MHLFFFFSWKVLWVIPIFILACRWHHYIVSPNICFISFNTCLLSWLFVYVLLSSWPTSVMSCLSSMCSDEFALVLCACVSLSCCFCCCLDSPLLFMCCPCTNPACLLFYNYYYFSLFIFFLYVCFVTSLYLFIDLLLCICLCIYSI